MKNPDYFNKSIVGNKEVIVRKEKYKELMEAVMCRSDMYHQFFAASLVYKEFKKITKKLELTMKERLIPRYDHDGSYAATKKSFLQAVGCAEEIHTCLCLQYVLIMASKDKKKLLAVIEQWSLTHLRLWALGLQKNVI